MDQQPPASGTTGTGSNLIRFSNDSNFTFVNYEVGNQNGFAYRRQARLHNAHRRRSRLTQPGLPSARPRNDDNSLTTPQPQSLLDAISSYARDPFSPDTLVTTRQLETIWRTVFPHYFYLPQTVNNLPGFQSPSDAFLNAARASPDIYRSTVVQAVVTNAARINGQANEAVFRNQALILRDFRRMADYYNDPVMNLTSEQFQHVFASAFSLSGHGFNKEAGYNAIIAVNSMMMSACRNQTIVQTAVSEWFRMLMPLPGPSFVRTEAYQTEMLRKANLVLAFLDVVQGGLHERFLPQVGGYLQPETAIYRLVTMSLPDFIAIQPYNGFHATCFHRILALLHRYFGHISQTPSPQNLGFLQLFEVRAAVCLQFPTPECITLFLWYLIADTVGTELNYDKDESLFSWAVKDLLSMHNITFKDELTIWLLHKSSPEMYPDVPVLDITEMRQKASEYYTQT